MKELTKILGKSYDNADFQNFLRKSQEKVTKLSLEKTYDELTIKLEKSYETLRKVSKIITYENPRNS